jgi:Helix-turn-helix domain
MTCLETLLTQNDYAELRRCSIRTIQRERARGTGCAFIRIGKLIRYKKADILQFVEAHRRGGATCFEHPNVQTGI